MMMVRSRRKRSASIASPAVAMVTSIPTVRSANTITKLASSAILTSGTKMTRTTWRWIIRKTRPSYRTGNGSI
uniref:Uncharacterized protein n=1 Tax=Anopheles funestus TaxID=62324 RepID=A0A4Y0BHI0_ANOFN